ncbi:heteromeric transposase endonuclease subunit TnsA [Marinifilum sp. JC120]|nr:heteromeric transposase endonuclease subunit TnsA [Marinifilum sp. JC120]
MPVRKIPKNYRNVTGKLVNTKSDGPAGFESTLERDFLSLLEFSPEVLRFEVQPVEINWIDSKGKLRKYTPDVLVFYADGVELKPTIFEVKYRSDLKKNWDKLKPKFMKALSFAKSRRWRFKIVSEKEIRTGLLKNVKFLIRFKCQNTYDSTHGDILLGSLKKLHSSTPADLLKSIYEDEWDQAELLPTLWYMVGTFQIGCDLSLPLTMRSEIWFLKK